MSAAVSSFVLVAFVALRWCRVVAVGWDERTYGHLNYRRVVVVPLHRVFGGVVGPLVVLVVLRDYGMSIVDWWLVMCYEHAFMLLVSGK